MKSENLTPSLLALLLLGSMACSDRVESEGVGTGAIEEADGPEPQPDLDRVHLLVHFRIEGEEPLQLGQVEFRAGPPPAFGDDAKAGVIQLLNRDGKVLMELPADEVRVQRSYAFEEAAVPHGTEQVRSVNAWIGLPFLSELAALRWIEPKERVTEWELSGALAEACARSPTPELCKGG